MRTPARPFATLLGSLLPPLCPVCRRGGAEGAGSLCTTCAAGLERQAPVRPLPPPGVDALWSAAPHEGTARGLVIALKFRRLLPAAGIAAEAIAGRMPADMLEGSVLVPVPAAPMRMRMRGFDPAAELTRGLARRTRAELAAVLRRRGGGRQRGRSRRERLLRAPVVDAVRASPPRAVLVDDVVTTGATLSSCAAALRGAGAREVLAVTFTHEL